MTKRKLSNYETDEILIELVKANEGLYNLQSPYYSDNQYKKRVWDEIGKSLNQNDAKRRWESLRSQYRKYLRKKETRSGRAAARIPKWKFEEQMHFLHEHLTTERPKSSSFQHEELSDETEDCLTPCTTFHIKDESNQEKKKIVPGDNSKAEDRASTTLMNCFLEKKKVQNIKHPIDTFFELMSQTVKTFNSIDQHHVKTKIFSIVNDMESKYVMRSPASFREMSRIESPTEECCTEPEYSRRNIDDEKL